MSATTSFIGYGTPPLAYPVLEDSTSTGVWGAYGAAKDEMVIIDHTGGGPPVVVESFQGSQKIYPSYASGKAELKEAIDTYLP